MFGCLCYASTLHNHRTKLQSRAKKTVFLGYKSGYKGFVLFDIHSREIFISRHVSFHENVLPYTQNPSSTTHDWQYFTPSPSKVPLSSIDQSPSPSLPIIDDIFPPTSSSSVPNDVPVSPRKSTRTRNAPFHLQDYVCNNSHTSTYPLSNYISYNNVSANHASFVLSLQTHPEPNTYAEASKHDCWKQARQVELLAFEKTGTWDIVDVPPHAKPIGCKWIFKVKHHTDGSVERYKARLVAKGYTQIEGLDYFDTYSPVAKMTMVRLVIALTSINNWFIHQLDVHNAFLHGDLQEDVYMLVPPGIKTIKSNQVCKLKKSLYGLKQASRKWYEKLTSVLLQHQYVQASSDHFLFLKKTDQSFTVLLVYVNDIILTGDSLYEFHHIKNVLDDLFKIKDLGQLKYFLGIEVAHSKSGISLCQRKYCLDLLSDSGFNCSKPVSTPSDPAIKLHNDSSTPFSDVPAYRRLIGRLIYLNNTRPDITFIT